MRKLTDQNWRRDPWFRALCSAIVACDTEREVADFLRDVGTLGELQAWGERLEVAKQLSLGLTYREVAENTGASTTTVTRVAKFLEDGEGGYKRYLTLLREYHRPHTHRKVTREERPATVLQKHLQR